MPPTMKQNAFNRIYCPSLNPSLGQGGRGERPLISSHQNVRVWAIQGSLAGEGVEWRLEKRNPQNPSHVHNTPQWLKVDFIIISALWSFFGIR